MSIDYIKILEDYINGNSKSEINFFKILKIQDYEIRHSAFLSWLLNPKENHNLEYDFFNKFLEANKETISGNFEIDVIPEYIITESEIDDLQINSIDLDLKKAISKRPDIVIKSKNNDFIWIIENKYGTKEHDEQCKCYKTFFDKRYPSAKKIYTYLDINKDTECPDGYKQITYETILKILNDVKSSNERALDFINQYIQILNEKYELIPINNQKISVEQVCIKINNLIYKKEFNWNDLSSQIRDTVYRYSNNIRYQILNLIQQIVIKENIDPNAKISGWRVIFEKDDIEYSFNNNKSENENSESKIKLIYSNTKKEFLNEDEYNKIFYLYGNMNKTDANNEAKKILTTKIKQIQW